MAFIRLKVVDFTDNLKDDEPDDDAYQRVLGELGIGEQKREITPIQEMPLVDALVDLNDIIHVMRLSNTGDEEYSQIGYASGGRSYVQKSFEEIETVLAEEKGVY